MIVINDFLGVYGGSITLIERLCIYLKQINEEVCVYTDSVLNTEIVGKLHNLNIEIRCFNTNSLKELKANLYSDSCKSQLSILNFTFSNYINVEIVKSKMNSNISNILYCIHPKTFYRGTGIRLSLFRALVKKFYGNVSTKIINQGQVVFMDQDCISATENFYGKNFIKNIKIQALPMICNELDKDSVDAKIHTSFHSKNIITACRAEFPFKGYIFGLIDNFVELRKKYKEITLTIVCSGPKNNVDKVKDKILKIDKNIQNSIIFYDWMSYQDLKALLSKSYLFVGMGTGVLDSALLYVPSIAVNYDTYECLSESAFYENPSCLASKIGCTTNAIEIMDKVLSLGEDEYKKICIMSFEKAKELYDIKKFVRLLLNMSNYEVNLTLKDRIFCSLNLFVNKFRKNKNYSCEEIIRQK